MREIKFRAWYRGTMYEHIILHFSPKYTSVEIIKKPNERKTENIFTDTDKAKLMQYTGLKDKNGVEIYEGDVVESKQNWLVSDTGEDETLRTTVSWDEKSAMYIGIASDDLESHKVIGNIYENKELLND